MSTSDKKFKTAQEDFWSGDFGDEYIGRNTSGTLLASNIHFFSNILRHTGGVESVLEFGANVGMNLKALRTLLPNATLSGIEINEKAHGELVAGGDVTGYHSSIFDFQTDHQRDLVLIKGVLIHINPDELRTTYGKLYDASKRYVVIAEYYNPSPVELSYRGHSGKLFKRDFAGEFMDAYPDVRLVNYGFAYRRDPLFPQDDITWFLFEKGAATTNP